MKEEWITKERNRISGEIHDMLGHTLTTVLIEIEVAKKLLSKNPSLAMEKLESAEGRIRKGIQDTREFVSILKSGERYTLIPSMQSLIEETEKHTGVTIEYDIHYISTLTKEQELFLCRALQEGLTNGILHGHSSNFNFTLQEEKGQILFSLKDNGVGCEVITFGFGLTSMKEWVEEQGGSLQVNFIKGAGCAIKIMIPIEKEKRYENYSSSDSRRPNTYQRWIENYAGNGR